MHPLRQAMNPQPDRVAAREGRPPLVCIPLWPSRLELAWDVPAFRHINERLPDTVLIPGRRCRRLAVWHGPCTTA